MRTWKPTTRAAGALAGFVALSLLLSACLGASLPKCNDKVTLDLLGDVIVQAFDGGLYGAIGVKNARVDNVRTTIELFHQNDPAIRGCRTTASYSVEATDPLASFSLASAGAQRRADGRMHMTEVIEYTIEWHNKRDNTIWLEIQTSY